MKYEYENQDELRKMSTALQITMVMFDHAYKNDDIEQFGEAMNNLKDTAEQLQDFKPIIKINVED
ncbi:hypothetical protein [Pediococcus pentosaceus]|uniref:hypothetical protein n=1 Tax=Pediococcus pentosaceus TaxID=1255 RepID=UPI0011B4AD44|nr:hypothetical protein [Pediococcus pentosaceus]QDZ69525.1 hypothetical protein PSL001_00770 [Pediococcus pentosaceus]